MSDKQKQIIELLQDTPFDELIDIMAFASDNIIWRPFFNDIEIKKKFDSLVCEIDKSREWDFKRNKEKGDLLENLMKLLFSRFVNHSSCVNLRTKDNEIDVSVKFNEVLSPPFIKNLKLYFICECKNKASASVDVGMVSKLVELCSYNQAGIGIFVSHKGVSGNGWKYGEGKRRKLFLSTGIPIISFKVLELASFSGEEKNFYTEIKKKYQALIDEVDYDGPSLKNLKNDNPEFSKFLIDTIRELKKINIISKEEKGKFESRITELYGSNN